MKAPPKGFFLFTKSWNLFPQQSFNFRLIVLNAKRIFNRLDNLLIITNFLYQNFIKAKKFILVKFAENHRSWHFKMEFDFYPLSSFRFLPPRQN